MGHNPRHRVGRKADWTMPPVGNEWLRSCAKKKLDLNPRTGTDGERYLIGPIEFDVTGLRVDGVNRNPPLAILIPEVRHHLQLTQIQTLPVIARQLVNKRANETAAAVKICYPRLLIQLHMKLHTDLKVLSD